MKWCPRRKKRTKKRRNPDKVLAIPCPILYNNALRNTPVFRKAPFLQLNQKPYLKGTARTLTHRGSDERKYTNEDSTHRTYPGSADVHRTLRLRQQSRKPLPVCRRSFGLFRREPQ